MVHGKIVANAPNVIASQPMAGAAISTPGLFRDCFVGMRLLAMTSFVFRRATFLLCALLLPSAGFCVVSLRKVTIIKIAPGDETV